LDFYWDWYSIGDFEFLGVEIVIKFGILNWSSEKIQTVLENLEKWYFLGHFT